MIEYIQLYETHYNNISFNIIKNFDNDVDKIFVYLIEDNSYIKFLEISKNNLSLINSIIFTLSDKELKKVEILKRFNSYSIFYQDKENKFVYKEFHRNIYFDLTNIIKKMLFNNDFEFIGISKQSVNINFTQNIEKYFGIFKVKKDTNIIYWKIDLIFDNQVENLENILGFIPETKIFFNINRDYKPSVLLMIDETSIKDIKFDSSSPTFFIEI